MSTVKIDFSDLHDAARKAREVSNELSEYANAIPGKVTNPLSSVTGGPSSHTQHAAEYASRKRRELLHRAEAYQRFGAQVDRFANNAKTTDEQVKKVIDAVADKRSEGLNWLQKILYSGYKIANGIFGSTEIGKFFNNLIGWGGVVMHLRRQAVKTILDWFRYGAGKYVLNIALSVLAIAGAITAMILAFPVGTVLAAIVAIATVVASVVTVIDSLSKIFANIKALSKHSTEPGQARYHGNIGSLEDWAKRETTNASFQNFAKIFDTTGKIAGAIAFFAGMGVTRAADGTKVTRHFDLSKGKFGLKFSSDSNSWKFCENSVFGYKKTLWSATNSAPQWFNQVEKADKFISVSKNAGTAFQSAMLFDGKYTGYSDAKNISKFVSSVSPDLSGFNKLFGYAGDLGFGSTLFPDPKKSTSIRTVGAI